jgi:hypothetical protein
VWTCRRLINLPVGIRPHCSSNSNEGAPCLLVRPARFEFWQRRGGGRVYRTIEVMSYRARATICGAYLHGIKQSGRISEWHCNNSPLYYNLLQYIQSTSMAVPGPQCLSLHHSRCLTAIKCPHPISIASGSSSMTRGGALSLMRPSS